jgi:hypothetical protein
MSRSVGVFIIINRMFLYDLFGTEYTGMLGIYIHTKFHMQIFNTYAICGIYITRERYIVILPT